jgi:hypothetical protein
LEKIEKFVFFIKNHVISLPKYSNSSSGVRSADAMSTLRLFQKINYLKGKYFQLFLSDRSTDQMAYAVCFVECPRGFLKEFSVPNKHSGDVLELLAGLEECGPLTGVDDGVEAMQIF